MEKWVEIRKSGDFMKMAGEYGISPVTARILRNRDLTDPQDIRAFLNPGEGSLHDPMMHIGMNRVVQVLRDKIFESKKIRIIGDYDVDGVCSTLILYKGLSFFGAMVDYAIPHRIEDGYGINISMIEAAFEAGCDTIITCDNGISASKQTDYAHELNMTMLITDHHEVPFEICDGEKKYIVPNADAIVDPKMPGEEYPFSGICGAYVAFQTIDALALSYGVSDSEAYTSLKAELLEFASLATVCDVMELKDENRTLVYKGMRLMEHSRNLGLSTLIDITGLSGKMLTPYHLGFVIGPCINATGRLDTPLRAVELFLETDRDKAVVKASELVTLNESRKAMTIEETEKAFDIIDRKSILDKVLVVYLPDCHESLAGIIAGKVREKYHRPSFVLTKTEDGLKGSGRSIDAYDMYEELSKVKDVLSKFGGHKLAAGLSLPLENLDSFVSSLNKLTTLTDEDFVETIRIDMQLPLDYVDVSLARELSKLEPYGVGNDKPLFASTGIKIISGTKMGKNKNVGKYKIVDAGNKVYEMIYFGNLDTFEDFVADIYDRRTAKMLHSGERVSILIDLCYQIEVNSFRGVDSAQIQMKYYR